jgi:hypothetical protein
VRALTDSSSLGAKVRLREEALSAVVQAHVFDAFCGTGEMWRRVWSRAASYVGCDGRPWALQDPVSRYVADNRRVMRAIDLSRFTVFDLDAYGSPWEQMLILAARRRFERGERVAIVLTDGASMKLRFGAERPPADVCDLLGRRAIGSGGPGAELVQDQLPGAWAKRARVRIVRQLEARGAGTGGSTAMRYTLLVVEGRA